MRPSLAILLVLTMFGWVLAGDVWGPDNPGAQPNKPPVQIAGRVQPSPRTSPGVVQHVAVDSTGAVAINGTAAGPLAAASPLGTVGQMPAAIVAASPGLGLVPGDAVNGLTVRVPAAISASVFGAAAHDAAISGAPVRVGGRARNLNQNYTAVATDDVADFVTTLQGQLRVVDDASDYTTGLDVKFVQAEAGGSTDVQVKAASGNLYKLFVSNPNTTDTYLSFYNATTASTTVGSTTQHLCFCVPGGTGASNAGSLELTFDPPISFSTAITYALTTTASGSTAPSSACVINIGYK